MNEMQCNGTRGHRERIIQITEYACAGRATRQFNGGGGGGPTDGVSWINRGDRRSPEERINGAPCMAVVVVLFVLQQLPLMMIFMTVSLQNIDRTITTNSEYNNGKQERRNAARTLCVYERLDIYQCCSIYILILPLSHNR